MSFSNNKRTIGNLFTTPLFVKKILEKLSRWNVINCEHFNFWVADIKFIYLEEFHPLNFFQNLQGF